MSRFNKSTSTVAKPDTKNLAGGEAYTSSAELELINLSLGSFLEDKYYESASKQTERLKEILNKVDPIFAAKVAIYARRVFGMRSITHVIAGELAHRLSGTGVARSFYRQIADRPDDMLEIAAYYMQNYGKTLPNAMKRGFAEAIGDLDAYRLSKYKGAGKEINMIDLVRLTHAKGELVGKLINDTLEPPETWEVLLTQAGSDVDKKAEVWRHLISEGKLGYLALLRNLRNIALQSDEQTLTKALEQLTDPVRVERSRVFPFQFATAYDQFFNSRLNNYYADRGAPIKDIPYVKKIISAIETATDYSLNNVPDIFENTLVAVDNSGSMSGRPSEIANLFGVAIARKGGDLLQFSDKAQFYHVSENTPILVTRNQIPHRGGGTNFHLIFESAKKNYDRIIVLSDMQGWEYGGWGTSVTMKTSFRDYRKRTGTNTALYSWNLNGYGDLAFPEDKVFNLAGWTDKVFDLMPVFEKDRKALQNDINTSVKLWDNLAQKTV